MELYTYNLLSSATKLEIYHKNIRPRKINVTCKEIEPGIPPPCSSKFYIVVKIMLNDRTHLLDTFQKPDIPNFKIRIIQGCMTALSEFVWHTTHVTICSSI